MLLETQPLPGKTYAFTYKGRICTVIIKKYVASPTGDYFIDTKGQEFFIKNVKGLCECGGDT